MNQYFGGSFLVVNLMELWFNDKQYINFKK